MGALAGVTAARSPTVVAHGGAYGAVVEGLLVAVPLALLVGYWLWTRRRRAAEDHEPTDAG